MPDSLATGVAAARRAVEAGPANHLAYFSLAQALFFQKDFPSFRNAVDRAVALNPMDGTSLAFLGELLVHAGDWEHGVSLAERAKQLNPHHPGWYWFANLHRAYRQGDDRTARECAIKLNLPGHWGAHVMMAAICGQLGEREPAANALKHLLELRPNFAAAAREELDKWYPDGCERVIDGLRKAGLDIPAPPGTVADRTAPETPSGSHASNATDGVASKPRESELAIAVLPFTDMSPAKDQEYLCEGMAEEIMNALVRIQGIRVASRTSAFRARREGRALADIAGALSVNYVLEGSVRTSGSRLRATAQLTDIATGYQIWSERFDRELVDVFAVQDEIAAGVVAAVKAQLVPGERFVRRRLEGANLEAYRCYLKGRHLRLTKNDFRGALASFEEAVRLDPSHAPSWIGMADVTLLGAHYCVFPSRDACATAKVALATAERLQGESAEGCQVQGFLAFVERRWQPFETAYRRAIELQPSFVQALGQYGMILSTRQRFDEARVFFERARQAEPLDALPSAFTGSGLLVAGRPEEALRYFDDAFAVESDHTLTLWGLGMARVALGQFDAGIAVLEQGVAVSRRSAFFVGLLGWAFATAGRADEAGTILEELRARPPDAPTLVPEAWLLGALGETDAAFAVLDRADQEYQALLQWTGLPGFDPLRRDPRFAALLERLGLPRERR